MNEAVVQVDHVWKKFRKGEIHDSLRELIPALCKRLVGKGPKRGDLNNKEFWALKDVNFEVQRGQSLGIIGPNGAGKSTMLKVLSRILKPNRGNYHVNGRISALIEVGAGFHPDLSGRENIYLNGTILGMKKAEIKAREEAIIEFSGIGDFIETPVKRYSSGMMARLGFSVAAHLEPDVLLVDEVLSVGDARFRTKCLTHMRNLVKSNTTVIFISHILEQVRSLCPNTLVLHKGEVVYHGQTEGAIKKYLNVLDGTAAADASGGDAEIANIQLTDRHGKEVLDWQMNQPGVLEFDLILRRAFDVPSVIVNLNTLSGIYLGTFNTLFDGQEIPNEPGRYHMKMVFDPMPLNDGDFALEFKVHEHEDQRACIWGTPEPRRFSVRGGKYFGMIIDCKGQWTIDSSDDSPINEQAPVIASHN
ncbi:MAG: polysaccharide ABC transporter ATP-binding protein [Phycisphaeraceae bacterium]